MSWRFGRLVVIVGVVAVLAAACTGGTRGHGMRAPRTRAHRPAAPSAAAHRQAPAQFRPPSGVPGDGESQYLSAFAQVGRVLVAVGGNHAGGVWRPVFLRSVDDGRTWDVGRVAGGSGASVADTAELVVARHGMFLALGEASGGVSAWTSRDGARWVRHSIPPAAMGVTAKVGALAATARGYVAVGNTSVTGRRDVPLAWTSTDGVQWTRRTRGLTGAAGGDLDVSDVSAAADGRRLVAVGQVDLDHGARDRPAVWRSGDAGASWHRVGLPAGLAGTGTRSWFAGVRYVHGEFVAVGAGGTFRNRHYSGVVATSRDGSSWTAASGGRGLSTHSEVYLGKVAGRGGQVLAFGTSCTRSCVIYGVSGRGRMWAAVRLPVGREGDDMALDDAFVTRSGAVLLAGSADPHGDDDARLWRSADGRAFAAVRLDALHAQIAPTVAVAGIASDGHREEVVGTAAGLPVVWASSDRLHFGEPIVLSRDPSVFASGISHGPAGWLITGGSHVGDAEQAIAWTSRDGVHWARSATGVFGRANTYAFSQIFGATAFRGWVVVGASSSDGPDYSSALAYRSTDGRVWHAADRRTKARAPGGGSVYDLLGGHSGYRVMNDVTPSGAGLLAVGYAQHANGSSVDAPAAWTSPDGVAWRLRWLPVPAGAVSAWVTAVVARGATAVAFGLGEQGAVDHACTWVSTDGGHSWRTTVLPSLGGRGKGVDAQVLERTPDGFVLAGSAGPPGSAALFVRTSVDGVSWRPVVLSDPRLAARGDWTIAGAVVEGHVLHGLASRTTPSGVVSFTFAQRV